MGERKGQNKYYPPDYDPKAGGLNKFLGTHALRERARKIHLGIIIIRFEMPYNIWCEGCKNHIGMGVRYNAEKTKVGMYYSTPVYQFRMKCHLCDNHFEIKTDPGNLDYEIVSGARRQENRWDPNENGQVVADTKEIQRKLFDDPMYKLEHVAGDLKKSEDAKPRLGRLYLRNQAHWDDDYAANCKLRSEFRTKKNELKIEENRDKALLAKSSLDIELLPESDQDVRLAAMMRLQTAKSIAEREKEKFDALINKPALPSATITSFGGLRSERLLGIKLNRKDLGIVKRDKRKAETTVSNSGDAKQLKVSDRGGTKSLQLDQESGEGEENSSGLEMVTPKKGNRICDKLDSNSRLSNGFSSSSSSQNDFNSNSSNLNYDISDSLSRSVSTSNVLDENGSRIDRNDVSFCGVDFISSTPSKSNTNLTNTSDLEASNLSVKRSESNNNANSSESESSDVHATISSPNSKTKHTLSLVGDYGSSSDENTN